MIVIEDRDAPYFAQVMQFAIANKAAAKLVDKLDYLAHYAEGDNKCLLFPDWAPNSFAFVMQRPDGTRWFNGGLIYSGPTQPLNGSGPAFTVGIGVDPSVHSWSVHT